MILIIILIVSPISIYCQSFVIKADYGQGIPLFSKANGELANSNIDFQKTIFYGTEGERQWANGATFSVTLEIQNEHFEYSEKANPDGITSPFLYFKKTYHAIPVALSFGYNHAIGNSKFHILANAGIGFGIVNSEKIEVTYSFDGTIYYVDPQGQSHIDTEHVQLLTRDLALNKILPFTKMSIGCEYYTHNFLFGVYVDERGWLSSFGNIGYHTEHSDTYNNFNRILDGDFSIRTEYLGLKLAIGWRFKTSKKKT